jgi:hypothetical protein
MPTTVPQWVVIFDRTIGCVERAGCVGLGLEQAPRTKRIAARAPRRGIARSMFRETI